MIPKVSKRIELGPFRALPTARPATVRVWASLYEGHEYTLTVREVPVVASPDDASTRAWLAPLELLDRLHPVSCRLR
jgi:hypothetical protein